jgi:hypothetical protein
MQTGVTVMPRRLPPYLELRPTGFYFRRIVRLEGTSHPAATEPKSPSERKSAEEGEDKPTQTARSTFNLSLLTRNEALARRITRRLTSVSDMLLEFCTESGMSLSPNIMLNVLREVRSYELAAYDLARASQGRRTLADAQAAIMREKDIQDVLRQALALNDGSFAEGSTKRALAAMGVSVAEAEADPSWQRLTFLSSRVLVDVSEERALREGGVFRTESPVLAEIATTLGCGPRNSNVSVFRSVRAADLPRDAFTANQPADTQILAQGNTTSTRAYAAPIEARPQPELVSVATELKRTSDVDVTDGASRAAPEIAVTDDGRTDSNPVTDVLPVAVHVSEPIPVEEKVAPVYSKPKTPAHAVEAFDLSTLRIDITVLSGPSRDAIRFPQKLTVENAFQVKEELLIAG